MDLLQEVKEIASLKNNHIYSRGPCSCNKEINLSKLKHLQSLITQTLSIVSEMSLHTCILCDL